MQRAQKRDARMIIVGLLALSLLGSSGIPSISQAADEMSSQSGTPALGGEAASKQGACCKPGDTTPPPELVAKTPKGQLKSLSQRSLKRVTANSRGRAATNVTAVLAAAAFARP